MAAPGRLLLAITIAAAAALTGLPRSGTHALAAPACPTLGSGGSAVTLTKDTAKSTTSDGNPIVVCNGTVPTFDGTPLDIDVTLPTIQFTTCVFPLTSCAPPLVMFLSGWSNDICQFESTSLEGTGFTCANNGNSDFVGNAGYHWNNDWAASNGMVALTYTPRGWWESCGKDSHTGYTYATDPRCSATGEESWVHLYDRRYEIRDAQYLAGLIADTGLIDPNRIVTTGDSGGGGPSWDLALSQDEVVQPASTPSSVLTAPWMSPGGTPLHLAAALPMYTWTDLVDSLVSNGTASDALFGAPADGDHHSPIGVDKESYVDGLFALGGADAQYATAVQDPTADLADWYAVINAGEPYTTNPTVQTAIDQIGGALRSPFSIPVPSSAAEKPIFVIQGLTDPLFPSTQPLTMINRLKAHDPNYPVYAFLGDVGHSYADNPLDVWQQAHNEGNHWLNEVLAGIHPTEQALTVDTTRCVAGQTLASYSGSGLASIATSSVTLTSGATPTLVHAAVTSPPTATYEGAQTDPIAMSGCRTMSASQSDSSPSQASFSWSIASPLTLAGSPVVHVSAGVTGTTAELAARLWDIDGGGNQTLITRTVYRIDIGTQGTASLPLAFELWPNAWQLQAGHTLKLELTQDDFPTWRPDNAAAMIALSNLSLTLPVVTSPATDTPDAPFAPLLPLTAIPALAVAALLRRARRLSAR